MHPNQKIEIQLYKAHKSSARVRLQHLILSEGHSRGQSKRERR